MAAHLHCRSLVRRLLWSCAVECALTHRTASRPSWVDRRRFTSASRSCCLHTPSACLSIWVRSALYECAELCLTAQRHHRPSRAAVDRVSRASTRILLPDRLLSNSGQVMETFRDRIFGHASANDEMPSPVVLKVRHACSYRMSVGPLTKHSSSTLVWRSGGCDGRERKVIPSLPTCSSTSSALASPLTELRQR